MNLPKNHFASNSKQEYNQVLSQVKLEQATRPEALVE
jgi:hypothetical protein